LSSTAAPCVACPPGTYKDAVGDTNVTSCRSCALGFTTLPPATSAASCLECRANTYATNTSTGGTTCMPCPQGYKSPPRSVGAAACQAHTQQRQFSKAPPIAILRSTYTRVLTSQNLFQYDPFVVPKRAPIDVLKARLFTAVVGLKVTSATGTALSQSANAEVSGA